MNGKFTVAANRGCRLVRGMETAPGFGGLTGTRTGSPAPALNRASRHRSRCVGSLVGSKFAKFLNLLNKRLFYYKSGGEGGIRTHGTQSAQRFSRPPRSTTPAPLRNRPAPLSPAAGGPPVWGGPGRGRHTNGARTAARKVGRRRRGCKPVSPGLCPRPGGRAGIGAGANFGLDFEHREHYMNIGRCSVGSAGHRRTKKRCGKTGLSNSGEAPETAENCENHVSENTYERSRQKEKYHNVAIPLSRAAPRRTRGDVPAGRNRPPAPRRMTEPDIS